METTWRESMSAAAQEITFACTNALSITIEGFNFVMVALKDFIV